MCEFTPSSILKGGLGQEEAMDRNAKSRAESFYLIGRPKKKKRGGAAASDRDQGSPLWAWLFLPQVKVVGEAAAGRSFVFCHLPEALETGGGNASTMTDRHTTAQAYVKTTKICIVFHGRHVCQRDCNRSSRRSPHKRRTKVISR